MQGFIVLVHSNGALASNSTGLFGFHNLVENRRQTCSSILMRYTCQHSLVFVSKQLALPSSNCFQLIPLRKLQTAAYVSDTGSAAFSSPFEEAERAKLVSKRLEQTSKYFKRLGSLGFWTQLVCTTVAAVILSFSTIISGKITSPATFYTTAGGIVAAFLSVFWSFGYIRLSERLKRTANEPAKAPHRAEVVKSLRHGVILNILGIGAAVFGVQATLGVLIAKALTTSAFPYYKGSSPSNGPLLALDVFLVQASVSTILSHFLGLISSLELLRSVTLPYHGASYIPRSV